MAKSAPEPLADPEDLFADTRMSFGDHIEDLRSHLMRAVVGFVVALVVCLIPPIGPWALKFITRPVEMQLQAFYDQHFRGKWDELAREQALKVQPIAMPIDIHLPALKKALAAKRGEADVAVLENLPDAIAALVQAVGAEPEPAFPDHEFVRVPARIPDPIALAKRMHEFTRLARPELLISMRIEEVFVVYFKVGLLTGFVFASPWIFYQIWSFIAVGLYPQEKRLVNVYLPISVVLFLAGFLLCEFFALPKAIEALLWFNEWLGFQPELRLSEWLGFALLMPLVFGVSFQTPLLMLFFFKIGLASLDTYRGKRRIAYFSLAVASAVLTPSPDAPTMMLLWVPLCALYEVGILLCKMQPEPPPDRFDDDLDPLVGV